jgi:hypothetical protein
LDERVRKKSSMPCRKIRAERPSWIEVRSRWEILPVWAASALGIAREPSVRARVRAAAFVLNLDICFDISLLRGKPPAITAEGSPCSRTTAINSNGSIFSMVQLLENTGTLLRRSHWRHLLLR